MSTTQWRDIPGYEGLYRASDDGRIFSLIRSRELKQRYNRSGYLLIGLYKDKVQIGYSVHSLIASAFLKKSLHDDVVHHKDGNKANNNLSNLEYMNRKEHLSHHTKEKHRAGKFDGNRGRKTSVGSKNPRAKLNEDSVRSIILALAQGRSTRQTARDFQISRRTISGIKKGIIWKHVKNERPGEAEIAPYILF